MANFHFPKQNPFQVPQNVGTGNIESKYLFNNYRQEWTPALWRRAIDMAIQYSDMALLDTLYSWCLQSSPFLRSQIDKRLVPLYKRNFVFGRNGRENTRLTDKYIRHSWWFKRFIRYIMLSQFYGAKMFAINPDQRKVVDFPLRNIDIFNEALRYQTFEYYQVINAADYDNLFFFQPESDQDFKLGLMQPISRTMIGMVEMFNDWQILGKRYSFPLTTIGYDANNAQAKMDARSVAQNLDMLTIPLIPYTQDMMNNGESMYSIEVNPINTQTGSDAFRVFKEFMLEGRSEIMQLVTGGTLLGATEKNTNSEHLAQIHWEMYQDILNADAELVLMLANSEAVKHKLAVIFDDASIESSPLIEIPDDRLPLSTFVDVGEMMAKQKMKYTPEAYLRVGIDPDDIEPEQATEQKHSLIKRIFNPSAKPTEQAVTEVKTEEDEDVS